MGCTKSTEYIDEKESVVYSKGADVVKMVQRKSHTDTIQVLLLGTSDSGKSTFLKQLRIRYGTPFTGEELNNYKILIHKNVINLIQSLCKAANKMYPSDDILKSDAFKLINVEDVVFSANRQQTHLDDSLVKACKKLWGSRTFKDVFERRSEFQITAQQSWRLLNKIDTVASPDYLPAEEDILFSRICSTGIREQTHKIHGHKFNFCDMGGQRNERRKWPRKFEGNHAVIFMVALSEFDEELYEAGGVNRMVESLNVFERYVNEPAFERSTFILFLNKSDLFREKIGKICISEIPGFEDYSGKAFHFDDGVKYFAMKFLRLNSTHSRVVVHVTTATETSNIEDVWNACQEKIISNYLTFSGFM